VSEIKIKYYSKKELAALYGITVALLRKEVLISKALTDKQYTAKRMFCPADVKKIFDKLGEP
jgi:hypothetical protein